MNEFDEARSAFYRASVTVSEIKERRRSFLRQRQDAAIAETEAIFGKELADAQSEETRLRREKEEAEEREAIAAPRDVPIGAQVEEWKPKRLGPWRTGPKEPTGRKGILEVITADSQHPGNKTNARRGDVVVRLLKKDGKPSRNYIHNKWSIDNEWIPIASGEK